MTEFEAEMLRELRAIRALLERRQVPRDERHVALVAAIAQASAGRAFTVSELVQHALVDPALCAAINGLSGRQLGRLLRRIEGQELSGLVVERIGEDSAGVIWAARPPKPVFAIARVPPAA